ncbi:MAG: MBL fold metallo-hydrolase, partial [Acetobacteraceae bacterium]|nr:MBL fold metallo-hydrolase [Acetobacteraceae bacterium]
MEFLTEPEPPRGTPTVVAPGVRRLVANNPGPMTYRGTNTYLLDAPGGVLVIDPGPDDPSHVAAILAVAPIAGILLTHGHGDHTGALAALRDATGAAVGVVPEGMVAIATPGHAADHVCFARADGVVWSGDLVMSWSTSVVSPPDGNMRDYLASLDRMLARTGDTLYLPGHGPPLADPRAFVGLLREHRLARERAVISALAATGGGTPATLRPHVYGELAVALHDAAERSLLAHLEMLV